jgi:hypothetical protein
MLTVNAHAGRTKKPGQLGRACHLTASHIFIVLPKLFSVGHGEIQPPGV